MKRDTRSAVVEEALDYGLFAAAPAAVSWLRERAPAPARLRVVGDDDTDGATGAYVLSTALRRAGYTVETTLQPIHDDADVDGALAGDFDAWITVDAGSAFLANLERRKVPVLVVDHHTVTDMPTRHVHEINPRRAGGRRTWGVSASVVSYIIAEALDADGNVDLAPAAIAGGISDRQHLGGFHGLLAYCVDVAVAHKRLLRSQGMTLDGPNVLEAITSSIDPFFAAFTGNIPATRDLLGAVNIDPQAAVGRIDGAKARSLATRLSEELSKTDGGGERSFPLFGDRLTLPRSNTTIVGLTHQLEALTAAGAHQLAMALLAGNPDAAEEAHIVQRQRNRRILDEVARLRSNVHDAGAFRWAETADAANTGVYAHVLLGYVSGDDKPLLVLAPVLEGFKASARGSPRLYLGGLDLSIAVPRAAAAVGGAGGGHPGASGATVPAGRRDDFLRSLASEITRLKAAV